MGQIEQLKEAQKIFIDAKDWEEVSRLQYEIDHLLTKGEGEKPKRLELWMVIHIQRMILHHMASVLKSLNKLDKELENANNKKPDGHGPVYP